MTTLSITATPEKNQAALFAGVLIVGAAMTWLVFGDDLLYCAAAIYAVGFMVLAWVRPAFALAAIFGAAPFRTI